MKQKIIIAALLLITAGTQCVMAQTMSVNLKSGATADYNTSDVESVTFAEEHEWVDLGLPSGTLWATCNVGANSPEEFGDWFAWGETSMKTNYDWTTYAYCNGTETTLTKYCSDAGYGTVDNRTELEPVDDAATVNMGHGWKMPTEVQMEELISSNNTVYTWTQQKGVSGYKITSKRNGKSIFLPAAGYYNKTSRSTAYNDYWTSTRSGKTSARELCFQTTSSFGLSDLRRQNGASVRAVRRLPALKRITLDISSLRIALGETKHLVATTLPTAVDGSELSWESSNDDVAQVLSGGLVVGIGLGTCTITCRADAGSSVQAECKVTVTSAVHGYADGHEWVDLGLPSGTLWATCNVGADGTPEKSGDYFAWGETTAKSSYTRDTYFDFNYSKYNSEDGLTELLPENDAATANWGDKWQMPSKDQIDELIDVNYTLINFEESGYRITSLSNGESIFIPCSGQYSESSIGAPQDGILWSRSPYNSSTAYSFSLSASLSHLSIRNHQYRRYFGHCVRPVRKK